MNGIMIVLTLLSGVALFLYGMSLMGDGLKRVAGNQLELVLYKLTNTPIKGVLLGTIVTAIIQSCERLPDRTSVLYRGRDDGTRSLSCSDRHFKRFRSADHYGYGYRTQTTDDAACLRKHGKGLREGE